jgi:hypothetical protein
MIGSHSRHNARPLARAALGLLLALGVAPVAGAPLGAKALPPAQPAPGAWQIVEPRGPAPWLPAPVQLTAQDMTPVRWVSGQAAGQAVILREGPDGQFAPQPAPLPPDAATSRLNGIVELTADDAMAVGVYTPTGALRPRPWAVHWTGGAWQPTILPATFDGGALAAVNFALGGYVAVGYKTGATAPTPVALTWTGGAWTEDALPTPPGGAGALAGVGGDGYQVAAVGAGAAGESWVLRRSPATGGGWVADTVPPGSDVGPLTAAYIDADHGWAAGARGVLGWNGTSAWARQEAPPFSGGVGGLTGVWGGLGGPQHGWDAWVVGWQGAPSTPYLAHYTESGGAGAWAAIEPPALPDGLSAGALAYVAEDPDPSRGVWFGGAAGAFPLLLHLLPAPVAPPAPPATPAPPCAARYTDLAPGDPFYPYVLDLTCRGVVSGYADGSFRPGALVTRAQVAKFVVSAAGLVAPIPAGRQTFADVPPDAPFWAYVERLAAVGALSGYTCGGRDEPCDGAARPDARPAANITRAQLARIITVVAALNATGGPTFADVPPGSPFFAPVDAVAAEGIVSGYSCGTPQRPCNAEDQPYFLPGAPATRGQTAKIISGASLAARRAP